MENLFCGFRANARSGQSQVDSSFHMNFGDSHRISRTALPHCCCIQNTTSDLGAHYLWNRRAHYVLASREILSQNRRAALSNYNTKCMRKTSSRIILQSHATHGVLLCHFCRATTPNEHEHVFVVLRNCGKYFYHSALLSLLSEAT